FPGLSLRSNPELKLANAFGVLFKETCMEILVYRNGIPKIQENFTAADLPELLKDESAVIWVDMEKPTEADERVLLDVFQFHPLTVEDCRENRHYPKVEEFENYLY